MKLVLLHVGGMAFEGFPRELVVAAFVEGTVVLKTQSSLQD